MTGRKEVEEELISDAKKENWIKRENETRDKRNSVGQYRKGYIGKLEGRVQELQQQVATRLQQMHGRRVQLILDASQSVSKALDPTDALIRHMSTDPLSLIEVDPLLLLDDKEVEMGEYCHRVLPLKPEIRNDLIKAYFDLFHPRRPLLHYPQFMAGIESVPAFQMYSLYSIAACMLYGNSADSLYADEAQHYSGIARHMAPAVICSTPLSCYDVIAFIWLSFVNGAMGKVMVVPYFSIAIQLAKRLNLGFEPIDQRARQSQSVHQEVVRRVWWCLFEANYQVSFTRGSPLMITLDDCQLGYPASAQYPSEYPFSTRPAEYPLFNPYHRYLQLVALFGDIWEFVRTSDPTSNASHIQRQRLFDVLQRWFVSLPPWMQKVHPDYSTDPWSTTVPHWQNAYYLQLFYTLQIILYSPHLMVLIQTNSPSIHESHAFAICTNSASAIAEILLVFKHRNPNFNFILIFMYQTLYRAALALMMALLIPEQISSSLPAPVEARKMHQMMELFLWALNKLGKTWLLTSIPITESIFALWNEHLSSVQFHKIKSTLEKEFIFR